MVLTSKSKIANGGLGGICCLPFFHYFIVGHRLYDLYLHYFNTRFWLLIRLGQKISELNLLSVMIFRHAAQIIVSDFLEEY